MDLSIFLEYGWVLLILIALEGILAADNALVMAIMVKHLPEDKRKKALFYGLAGALVFRLGSLFIISSLVHVWQVQAIGAVYLLFIAIHHLLKKYVRQNHKGEENQKSKTAGSGFWLTVLKVELADIAFAVDSILAAVALAVTLPETGLPKIGGLDGAQFLVILLGGMIGLVLIRFAATWFVQLLQKRPGLEVSAFLIVGWVGVKLAVYTLSHPELAILSEEFAKSLPWKLTFWAILIGIAIGGWVLTGKEEKEKYTNLKKVESQ
jgi:YkoY family integral membrane protein